MSEDLTTKRLSPMVIQTPSGPLAVMKYDPEGNYLHWSDSGDHSVPPLNSAGVVVTERMVNRAIIGYTDERTYDRLVSSEPLTLRDLRRDMRAALVAALGGEGG